MDDLHFTNFQSRQGGRRAFRYRLCPTSSLTAADVTTFGRRTALPLLAHLLLAGERPA